MIEVIFGMQWGDEGKGKVLSFINADAYVRVNGGPNAGHTIEQTKVHQVPPGIEGKLIISATSVVDVEKLIQEIDRLDFEGYEVSNRLIVDDRAHLITAEHIRSDVEIEDETDNKIGTTRTGNGPVHADKYARTGIRLQDSQSAIDSLSKRGIQVGDTTEYLRDCLERSEQIAILIAHGAMLDIDFGTYPFVTSSQISVLSALRSCGFGLQTTQLESIYSIGVIKAFTTRVAPGPMRGEITGQLADKIRTIGNEYGTTTSRPRRIGWIDIGQLEYVAEREGPHQIFLTKLDVLAQLNEPIRIVKGKWNHDHEVFEIPEIEKVSFKDPGVSRMVEEIETATGGIVVALGNGPGKDDIVLR